MELLLLRHGNTFRDGEVPRYVGARSDLNLTDFGREQAERAAGYIRQQDLLPDLILHGPLRRHRETANILQDRLNRVGLIVEPRLNEIDYGPWENLTEEQILDSWSDELGAWKDEGKWPAHIFVTQQAQFRESIAGLLGELLQNFPQKRVLLVTSNGVLRELAQICCADELPQAQRKVATGALSLLTFVNNSWKLSFWNRKP